MAAVHIDDCKSFIKCLSDYFDGEIDEETRIEFEEHIKTCSNARAMVQTFERTIILHRRNRGRGIPPGLHERLIEAVRKCSEKDR